LVPRSLTFLRRARAFAECPDVFDWGELHVEYPRWAYYPVDPVKRWSFARPKPALNIGWMSARSALLRIVDESRPDVVFAHHTAVNGYVAARIKMETGIPFVVTDHDFDEIASCERFPARYELFREVVAAASVSVLVARRMQADMDRLFPHAHTRTVYNGVDPIPFDIRTRPRPNELQGRLIFFAAGFFYERKGFPLLVEAFNVVAQRFPEAVLRIAGDGTERAEVERVIRQCKLEDRVALLGATSHSQVLQEMVWADVFSLIGWDEPFATVYLEAAAAGKPIVLASDGGFNDVLRSGVHGISVAPRDRAAAVDALLELAGDRDRREAMGRAACDLWKRRLTWDSNADQMLRVFAEAKRPASRPSFPLTR
jgi:glycosyltransferase involved in cell wall biosynthesis